MKTLLMALIVIWGGSAVVMVGAMWYMDWIDKRRDRRAVRKEWEI